MKYHMIAFFGGFILDLMLGDPYWLPHPIRLIGSLITWLEHRLLRQKETREERTEYKGGLLLAMFVLLAVFVVSASLLVVAYRLHPVAGCIVELIMTYQILATKCLKKESMKVYDCLKKEGLESARTAVSMIVGRDTDALDETGVIKAAVETVAENASDGVIAPMIYTAIGGPVLGFLYKAVNTMDSMVGYKNDRYLYFGRGAARLDDAVNYIPARISAYLMILAAFLGGKCFDGKAAYRIFLRDRYNHASPNSAQTESACAGALGVRLAGNASYFGQVVRKPYIGDPLREAECEDIRRVNRLLYIMAVISEACCMLCMAGVGLLTGGW